MKSATLKISLAIITTLGTIAVAAVSIFHKSDDKSSIASKPVTSISVNPNMTQSNDNISSSTNNIKVPVQKPPIVNTYIIQQSADDSNDTDDDTNTDQKQ